MPLLHPQSQKTPRRLECFVAADTDTVIAAQRLRYRIFADEMGARLHTAIEGLDRDEFDDFCDHLVVWDGAAGRIVGCSRLLRHEQAGRLGRFYSESEFHLQPVLSLPGRFLEVGRTCVDSAYRGGAVLTTLWSGLVHYAREGNYDYLMGCASIPPGPNGFAVEAIYRDIDARNVGPDSLRVEPKTPVPLSRVCRRNESGLPPLLKAYLRFGAWVCGEPCWDADFNVIDVFILLPFERLEGRYSRHFLKNKSQHGQQIAPIL